MRKHSSKRATRNAVKPQWSVGLDLADRSSRYAIVDCDGELRAEGECGNTPAGLAGVFGEMPASRVAPSTCIASWLKALKGETGC